MKANLLYIRESDLTPEFQSKLCSFKDQAIPLYIIVQLKGASQGFVPMINNLKDIRIEKAVNKIKNWMGTCFGSNENLIIKINDENSPAIRVDIDLTDINDLSIFCAPKDSKTVHLYIKNKLGENNFKISYL